MKKKSILSVLLSVIMCLSFASCGGSKPTSSNTSNEQVTLRFATWDTGEMLNYQKDIAKKFEELNPKIKVKVEAYADGFDQKMAASFGAKNPPDVMYMWDFPTYHDSLEPLDEYVKKDSDIKIDDFYPALLNYNKINGTLYGVPVGYSTHVIYYNKKLFDQSNVPYPKDGWTWDDFRVAAKKISKPQQKIWGFIVRKSPDPNDFEQFLWSNGTSYISKDGKTLEGYMNSPEAIESMQMFVDMVKEGGARVSGTGKMENGGDMFKAGKLGMWENGMWSIEGFKQAGIDFGIVSLPAFKGKPVKSMVNESAVSISKDSKNKEAAWKFVKFYTSEEGIKMRKGELSVRMGYVKDQKIDQDPIYKPFYDMVKSADGCTPAFLLNPKWNEIMKNLSMAIEGTYTDLSGVKEKLDKSVKDSAKYLQ